MITSSDRFTFEERRDSVLAVVVSAQRLADKYPVPTEEYRLYTKQLHEGLEQLRIAVSKMNTYLINSAVADFMQENKE